MTKRFSQVGHKVGKILHKNSNIDLRIFGGNLRNAISIFHNSLILLNVHSFIHMILT